MRTAKLIGGLVACLAVLAFGAGSAAAYLPPEFVNFTSAFKDPSGAPLLEAGAHADLETDLEFKRTNGDNVEYTLKDIEVQMPAGFYGNPAMMKTCRYQDIITGDGQCDPAAQVGVLAITPKEDFSPLTSPVYVLPATDEQTAVLGMIVLGVPVRIVISARSDGDYGLTSRLSSLNEAITLQHTTLTLWGVPADPAHDAERACGTGCAGVPAGVAPEPFLSLPTRCEPMITTVRVDTWQEPGNWVSDSYENPPLTGCEKLDFSPSLSARPTTDVADSPSGLEASLAVPQNVHDPDKPSSAMLRTAEVTFPEGLAINPSAANGLGACDLTQIGYTGRSDERQLLRFDPKLTTSFTASYGGASTPELPADAEEATVAAAIEALPGLAGNVSLEKAPRGWLVTFTGALAGTDVAAMGGTATDKAGQSVTVTAEGGGYNLQTPGGGTEASFEAELVVEDPPIIFIPSRSRDLKAGELIEGPGIAPGTELAQVEGASALLSQPATPPSGPIGPELITLLRHDASAAQLQAALEEIPDIGPGNVVVTQTGAEGTTRSFKVVLAGAEPTLTASSSLSGAGAGVQIAPAPESTHELEVRTLASAGTPLFDKSPAECPDASRIGTAEVITQVFPNPLKGDIYTMTPYQNPFGSLLGVYVAIEGKGLVIKLPGEVRADPKTGQLTSTFDENPQLPFEEFKLDFDGGAFGILRTPAACGDYATDSVLSPWSAPETPTVTDKDSWAITQAPSGGSCAATEAERPNSPSFQAGTTSAVAGAYSPFVLKLSRNDGTRQLTGIDAVLPKGLSAKLVGTSYCPDAALAAAATKEGKAEQASPSCPASSQVATLTVGSGAGPRPFYAPGTAYLAGPYKGAPLSLAVIVPAVAGPFDLGTVVVRNALWIDPATAQVHAVSDPFPTILQGIPLDLRSVELRIDKPQFTKNPTSCDPFQITGFATVIEGQPASLENRFQVAECGRLAFKPKLAISFKGKTKRTGNPALTAVLKMPAANQANIAKTTVVLPQSMFIDNSHIANPCTRVQFDAKACPKDSILGKATAFSPLLAEPLRGPVYFRSNGGERELPDLVADLDGQIHVTLVGFIDSVKTGPETARIRTRFANVPDAPVSKFVLKMAGGKKGLLKNSVNLCRSPQVAGVQMEAQNAKTFETASKIAVKCKKGKGAKKGKKGR